MKAALSEWVGSEVIGYSLNVGFSAENASQLETVIQHLHTTFPGSLWSAPADTLHITLIEYIGSRNRYDGQNKDELFQEYAERYDKALQEILCDQKPILINFTELKVTNDTIIAVGQDDGSFARIRAEFASKAGAVPSTKPVPNIIHTSLCRFRKEVELEEVRAVVARESISFMQIVDKIRLVKILRTPMLEHEVLKEYVLGEK